jgi:hypothetical protein
MVVILDSEMEQQAAGPSDGIANSSRSSDPSASAAGLLLVVVSLLLFVSLFSCSSSLGLMLRGWKFLRLLRREVDDDDDEVAAVMADIIIP